VPIKEYKCSACGAEVEKLVRIMDPPPICPECGEPTFQVWSKPAPAQWKCSKGSL
jgi:putative FmdB family regulatory protein